MAIKIHSMLDAPDPGCEKRKQNARDKRAVRERVTTRRYGPTRKEFSAPTAHGPGDAHFSIETMSAKQKPAKISGSSTGLYKADSVKVCKLSFSTRFFLSNPPKDVAESLGITNLPDTVASALASDVEYRIHQVIEVRHVLLHACHFT
jgi:TATA box binding protein associated factor (TAF)